MVTTGTAATTPITLTLGASPASAVLGGLLTVNATAGVANFSNLTVNLAGTYTINAGGGGLTATESTAFTASTTAATKLVVTVAPSLRDRDGHGHRQRRRDHLDRDHLRRPRLHGRESARGRDLRATGGGAQRWRPRW